MYSCVVYVARGGEIIPRFFEFPTVQAGENFVQSDACNERIMKYTIIGPDGTTIKG